MYRILIKPLLFLLRADHAHQIVLLLLRLLNRVPLLRSLVRSIYNFDHPSLGRDVFGVHFRNPVGVAAGFDVNAEVVAPMGALGFGFVEVGAITAEPQSGVKRPRIYRLDDDRALVRSNRCPSRGWNYAIDHLRRRQPGVVVGCNLSSAGGTQLDLVSRDYLKSFRNLYQYVDYFTLTIDYENLQCSDKASAIKSITQLLNPLFDFRRGQNDYRPILVKVTADLNDDMINAVSNVLITTPMDGVVAVSGTRSRKGLQSSSTVVNRAGNGMLTGVPLRERALEVVRMLHKKSGGGYPIIGVGGIMTADDVRAMMAAGASLVQLYSGLVYEGPSIAGDICRGLVEEENL
ncbi:MAG: quinone-dependent dihydroorotate dehydrogenase [Rikenellaceae bacterium]